MFIHSTYLVSDDDGRMQGFIFMPYFTAARTLPTGTGFLLDQGVCLLLQYLLAKVVLDTLRVKYILFAIPRTNTFGLEN